MNTSLAIQNVSKLSNFWMKKTLKCEMTSKSDHEYLNLVRQAVLFSLLLHLSKQDGVS